MNQSVPINQVSAAIDAQSYERKAMAMAYVMFVVRQRGDLTPNSFDMQTYDCLVANGDNMVAMAQQIAAPEEAQARLGADRSYSGAMAQITSGIRDLHANDKGADAQTRESETTGEAA